MLILCVTTTTTLFEYTLLCHKNSESNFFLYVCSYVTAPKNLNKLREKEGWVLKLRYPTTVAVTTMSQPPNLIYHSNDKENRHEVKEQKVSFEDILILGMVLLQKLELK